MKSYLKNEIRDSLEVTVDKCYQCGKCSAGCPLGEEMDFPPSYLMRLLQTGDPGLQEKVLRSFSIWLCLTCETCYSRCPMNMDIPKIMDFLREKALKENKAHRGAKKILAFHRSFLKSIEKTGRLYELGVLADYKAHTLQLMQDMDLVPKMLSAGKLKIIPELIRDRSGLSSIFSNTIKKQ